MRRCAHCRILSSVLASTYWKSVAPQPFVITESVSGHFEMSNITCPMFPRVKITLLPPMYSPLHTLLRTMQQSPGYHKTTKDGHLTTEAGVRKVFWRKSVLNSGLKFCKMQPDEVNDYMFLYLYQEGLLSMCKNSEFMKTIYPGE